MFCYFMSKFKISLSIPIELVGLRNKKMQKIRWLEAPGIWFLLQKLWFQLIFFISQALPKFGDSFFIAYHKVLQGT